MAEESLLLKGLAVEEPETDTLRFTLPVFEGPLDLMLYLIGKNEIDIYDIPILEITAQYEEYLQQMRELDLEVAADFILMAATLIHIKSRMLLPPAPDEGGEEWEDPRKPLVDQLLEYRRYRELAGTLLERHEETRHHFSRGDVEGVEAGFSDALSVDVDLYDLVSALQDVLKRAADRKERLIYAPEVTLAGKINDVLEKLEAHGSLLFTELFEGAATRLQIAVTFLAVLELARQRVVRIFQKKPLQSFRVALSAR